MLISALCDYYDDLARDGKVVPEGYSEQAVHYLIALKADTIPTEKSWVLPGLALGILAVFVLSHLILYLIDRKEAEKLNADLARYQEKQIAQSEDKDEI